MNKIELLSVVLLFAVLVGWGFFQKKNAPVPQQTNIAEAVQAGAASSNNTGNVAASVDVTPSSSATTQNNVATTDVAETKTAVTHENPEVTVSLVNDVLKVDVSSGLSLSNFLTKNTPPSSW